MNSPISVGHLSTAYHTAVLLMGSGWAEGELGRPVNWRLLPTGPDIVNGLAKRELDMAYIGLTPAMIGIGRGVPIKCVAGGHVEGTVLAGKAHYASIDEQGGSLPATLAQFQGKAIGCPKLGSIHDIIIRHSLVEAALDGAVEVKNFDSAEFIAEAIADGVVEAAGATPSIVSYLGFFTQRFLSKVLIPPNRLWPFNPSYGIFARVDLIEDQPEVVQGFLKAHKRATTHMRQKPREAAKTVARVMEIVDEDYVLQAYAVSPKYCIAVPQEYLSSTLRFVEPLQRLGYLKRDLEQEDIFDLRLVENLHPEPHHYGETPAWQAG